MTKKTRYVETDALQRDSAGVRADLAEQMAAFIASGGKPKQIPTGVTGQVPGTRVDIIFSKRSRPGKT
jgi:hypothetical protein